jgi:hypothetical protein
LELICVLVAEILHAAEGGIESEGAARLRSLERDGQQLIHGIGEAGSAGAGGGEGGEGSGIGGDDGAMAIVAALQVDADERAVVGAGGGLRHGRERVELDEERAGIDAGHGGQ